MTLRISLCCDAAHQTARTLSHSAILGLQLDFAADFHDALEFPDGSVILLTSLWEGQEAVVLSTAGAGENSVGVRGAEARRLHWLRFSADTQCEGRPPV